MGTMELKNPALTKSPEPQSLPALLLLHALALLPAAVIPVYTPHLYP